MEFNLTPEAAAKLNELARRTHRGTDELLEDAVDHLIAHHEWFEQKVKGSMAAIERGEIVGEIVPGEEVPAWIEKRGTLQAVEPSNNMRVERSTIET